MAILNHFIMNTDYDSLKIVDHAEWDLSYPETTLNAGESNTIEYTFPAKEGVYFETSSATLSLFPGLSLTGGSYISASKFLTPGQSNTSATIGINIFKKDATTYAASVSLSNTNNNSLTIPAFTGKIKLNLLIPSEETL